ncbi:MAG: hypothetical protein WC988_03590, partial [Patescibacteria group bacterium]
LPKTCRGVFKQISLPQTAHGFGHETSFNCIERRLSDIYGELSALLTLKQKIAKIAYRFFTKV